MMILFFIGDINYFLYRNQNIERSLLLALQKTINDRIPINVYQSAVYALNNHNPNICTLIKILSNKINSLNLNRLNVNIKGNHLNNDNLETGLKGLGSLIKKGLDERSIKRSLLNREMKYKNSIYIKRSPYEEQVSPYLSDGLAGLAIAIINRKDLLLNDYIKYFKGLLITDSKSPGFFDGLTGIAYTNMKIFQKTCDPQYINTAWIQIRNASQYVEFKDGYSYFRQFNNNHLEKGIYNGFEGFIRVYEEMRIIGGVK